jgi:uncharacterized protein DUF5985
MKEFLWGMLAMASTVVSLLFLRYCRVTRDRLFLYFSAAFLAIALNYVFLALIEPNTEDRYLAYCVRLLAFVLILVGIVDKNLRAARRPE